MRGSNIELDRNLYLLAFSILVRNWQPYAVAALLLLTANASVGFVDAPLVLAALRTAIFILVSYSAYRYLLTDGAASGWQSLLASTTRPPWRYAGVMLIVLSPILLLGIAWTVNGSGGGPSSLGDVVFGFLMVILYASFYVLLGTALPASAERDEMSLREGFARGRRNYGAIGRSLVLGVWVFRAASVLVMMVLAHLGVTTDFASPGSGQLNLPAVGPMLLFNLSHIFAELLTAVVLVRAYRKYPAIGFAVAGSGQRQSRSVPPRTRSPRGNRDQPRISQASQPPRELIASVPRIRPAAGPARSKAGAAATRPP
jgi:hypothetical protein